MASPALFIAILGGVLPALVWLAFWLLEDRCEPEPKRYLLGTFIVGGLMVGLVANPHMVAYFSTDKKTPPVSVAGLLYGGGWAQVKAQAIAALVIILFNIVVTYAVLKIVALFVPLRASDGEVEGGDLAIHGIDPLPIPKATVTGIDANSVARTR